MDFTQCFYQVDPEIVTKVLRRAGLPKNWTTILKDLQGGQKRYISIHGQVPKEPTTVRTSTPLGCPLSPIALIVLVATVGRMVESETPNIVQVTYIDDTTIAANASGTRSGPSGRMGLVEKNGKLQILVDNEETKQVFTDAGYDPDIIRDEIQILGSTISSRTARTTSTLEQKRGEE